MKIRNMEGSSQISSPARGLKDGYLTSILELNECFDYKKEWNIVKLTSIKNDRHYWDHNGQYSKQLIGWMITEINME